MESRADSTGEARPDAGGLRQYLERVVPDARLTSAPVDSKFEPLLLMQTTYVMAAFAFPNGDAHNDFEILYGGFKQYYMKQSRSSDERELADADDLRHGSVRLSQW